MIQEQDAGRIVGSTAYASDGDKIGKVGQLYLDDDTGRPEFITVNTGLFGTSESFVPVAEATFTGDRLTVPFTKDTVKDAPNVDLGPEQHLDRGEEQRLYEYYGLTSASSGQQTTGLETGTGTGTGTAGAGTDTGIETGTGTGTGTSFTEGHDTSGPTTDDAMTRSEEHVEVG